MILDSPSYYLFFLFLFQAFRHRSKGTNYNWHQRHLYIRGARGVMDIVVGNGHGDTSSNPGRNSLHFHIEKDMIPIILPPAMGK